MPSLVSPVEFASSLVNRTHPAPHLAFPSFPNLLYSSCASLLLLPSWLWLLVPRLLVSNTCHTYSNAIYLFLTSTLCIQVVDRQISVPVTVSCIINDNFIDILKRWGEPTTTPCATPTETITKSVSVTPSGTTSWATTTVTSTATPFGGACPCYSAASKKRFVGMLLSCKY
jgi:hypothetical protein